MDLTTVSLKTRSKKTEIPATVPNYIKPIYGGVFEEDTLEIEYDIDPASGVKIDLANSTTSVPVDSPGPIPINIALVKGTGPYAAFFRVKLKANLRSNPTRLRKTGMQIVIEQKPAKDA